MAEQPPPGRTPAERPTRSRVIIVAGFGGLSEALKLSHRCRCDRIDQRNHHLFQPLLYQVATAELSPADIDAPIRGILGRQANTRVVLGRLPTRGLIRVRLNDLTNQVPRPSSTKRRP